ncbi:hypothetical protein SLOPH_2560, partial [Spraguea lophii 42_110]
MIKPFQIVFFILYYLIKLLMLKTMESFINDVFLKIMSIILDIILASIILSSYILKNHQQFTNISDIIIDAYKKNIILYNTLVILLLTLTYYIFSLIIFLPIKYFNILIVLDNYHSDRLIVFDYPYEKIHNVNEKNRDKIGRAVQQ